MRVPHDAPLARTWPLTIPDRTAATIAALSRPFDRCALEGLVEVVHTATTNRIILQALRAIADVPDDRVADACMACLSSPHASVRTEALTIMARRTLLPPTPWLTYLLTNDPSWPTRRATVVLLASHPAADRELLYPAATDPHWRVRHALIQALITWDSLPAWEDTSLLPAVWAARVTGVLRYVAWRRGWPLPASPAVPSPPEPPFFDADPAVLVRNLEQLDAAGRGPYQAHLPELLIHDDERVRRWALRTLRYHGTPALWAACIALLDDPRTASATMLAELSARWDTDDQAAVWQTLAALETRSLAQQMWLQRRAPWYPPSPELPPLSLQHPFQRAAALTATAAHALVAEPTRETSWYVLRRACHLARVPVWSIAPEEPPNLVVVEPEPPLLTPTPGALVGPRFLGPLPSPVTPLGVSGHYGLPVVGFVRALEAGVNLYFWEPNYTSLSTFAQRLAPSLRGAQFFVAGTFAATPKDIRRDCERALTALRIDRLALFLLFWTRSWERITDEVRAVLDDLRVAGKVHTTSLSTHDRTLAVQAIHAGWNPVMVRHSAAHRGAETAIYPHAIAHGASLLTFNNTCYGRLLQPHGATLPPSAADCYRYALAQPAVSACWTAPATLEQLDHNLQALRDPVLPPDRLAALLAHGAAVYAEDTTFRQLVRTR